MTLLITAPKFFLNTGTLISGRVTADFLKGTMRQGEAFFFQAFMSDFDMLWTKEKRQF
jgi:hypothetical protein